MSTQEPVTLEDLKELLEENLEVSEETNKLLRAMRRDALISAALKLLIWIIIVGGASYFLYQTLAPIMASYEAAAGSVDQFRAFFDFYGGSSQ